MLLKEWLARHPLVDKLNIFYDVACVLKKFLQVISNQQRYNKIIKSQTLDLHAP